MKKRISVMMLLLVFTLIFIGCDNESNDNDQDNVQDVDSINNDNNPDDTPNNEDPDDTPNNEDQVPPETEGDHFAEGYKEARETYEHEIVIETAGVYDIYSVSTFDSVGVLKLDGDQIKYDGRIDDFMMTVYLEPSTYVLEFRSFSRDDTGTYKLYLEYREDLTHVVYYVEDSVAIGSITSHTFTIDTAGTYTILGNSDIKTQGTLYNKTTGSYLTTDFEAHPETGFLIEFDFEPGTYEIQVRGYDWSAAVYDILVYPKE